MQEMGCFGVRNWLIRGSKIPTTTAVLTNRQVPAGVFCPLALGCSNEPITARCTAMRRKHQKTSDTKVRFMLHLMCFKTVFLGFNKRKDELVGLESARLINFLTSDKEQCTDSSRSFSFGNQTGITRP